MVIPTISQHKHLNFFHKSASSSRTPRIHNKKSGSYIDIENDYKRLITHRKSLECSLNSTTFLRKKKTFKKCGIGRNVDPKKTVQMHTKKLITLKYLLLSTFSVHRNDGNIEKTVSWV